jgi:hypothetical protein
LSPAVIIQYVIYPYVFAWQLSLMQVYGYCLYISLYAYGPDILRPIVFRRYLGVLFGFGEAIPAVYRFIAARLKRDFSLFTALSTGSRIHLARASIAKVTAATAAAKALGPSGGTASRTTLGLIGEAFSGKKFLLFSSKGERFSTIGALQCFLSETH